MILRVGVRGLDVGLLEDRVDGQRIGRAAFVDQDAQSLGDDLESRTQRPPECVEHVQSRVGERNGAFTRREVDAVAVRPSPCSERTVHGERERQRAFARGTLLQREAVFEPLSPGSIPLGEIVVPRVLDPIVTLVTTRRKVDLALLVVESEAHECQVHAPRSVGRSERDPAPVEIERDGVQETAEVDRVIDVGSRCDARQCQQENGCEQANPPRAPTAPRRSADVGPRDASRFRGDLDDGERRTDREPRADLDVTGVCEFATRVARERSAKHVTTTTRAGFSGPLDPRDDGLRLGSRACCDRARWGSVRFRSFQRADPLRFSSPTTVNRASAHCIQMVPRPSARTYRPCDTHRQSFEADSRARWSA